jgi:hypothetical protein
MNERFHSGRSLPSIPESRAARGEVAPVVECRGYIGVEVGLRAGELLAAMELSPGPKEDALTLRAMGLERNQSSRWQRVASIPGENADGRRGADPPSRRPRPAPNWGESTAARIPVQARARGSVPVQRARRPLSRRPARACRTPSVSTDSATSSAIPSSSAYSTRWLITRTLRQPRQEQRSRFGRRLTVGLGPVPSLEREPGSH